MYWHERWTLHVSRSLVDHVFPFLADFEERCAEASVGASGSGPAVAGSGVRCSVAGKQASNSVHPPCHAPVLQMDPSELRSKVSMGSMKHLLRLLAIVAVQDAWWFASDEKAEEKVRPWWQRPAEHC